jgi:hypothetical protein
LGESSAGGAPIASAKSKITERREQSVHARCDNRAIDTGALDPAATAIAVAIVNVDDLFRPTMNFLLLGTETDRPNQRRRIGSICFAGPPRQIEPLSLLIMPGGIFRRSI